MQKKKAFPYSKRLFSIVTFSLLLLFPLYSQVSLTSPDHTTRILFVFDASQSMAGQWEKDSKISIAREILIRMVDSLEQLDGIELALRVYGHQSPVPPQDCSDTRLEVPFSRSSPSQIRQKLHFLKPRGTTPIANSLTLAANDFGPCENCRNIIILITDGIEACDGDPCEVSYALQKKGIVLKPFVIGIGMDEDFRDAFDCIGNYYNAEREEKFEEILNVVISQALNSTTAQVNLLDESGLPTETNVNMIFFDQFSGKIKHNFYHTINHRGNPDTLVLDPLVTYRIEIQTIPKVTLKNAKVVPGKHTIFAADAPQGTLVVKVGDNQYRGMQYIVRKTGGMETLNMQTISQSERYITGKYDLEIPTIPRLNINGVNINQSETTTVEIPRPGLVTFIKAATGFGSLYVMRDGKMEWVYNLDVNSRTEALVLQPGNYKAVFRSLNARQSIYTITRSFKVLPGGAISVEFY